VLTLDQIGISEADWNQMPAAGRVAIMFLLKQNQLLENRNYTYHLEVERLKTELERLKLSLGGCTSPTTVLGAFEARIRGH
jgi:hypothetical protein